MQLQPLLGCVGKTSVNKLVKVCTKSIPLVSHHTNAQHTPIRHIRRIHLVGIGGVGMCALAHILQCQGYTLSGSDIQSSENTDFLNKIGITVYLNHAADHLDSKPDIIVTSSAIAENNPEIRRARTLKIPIISRGEMLAELMRFHTGIAVAGTHGKTTTTGMIASILQDAGQDPTFLIGGRLNANGNSARLGHSRTFITEADESDASLLHLRPVVAVITNIDADHMATYQDSITHLHNTFVRFMHNLPFYGLAVVCIDDPGIRTLLPRLNQKRLVTYGCSEDAALRIVNLQQHKEKMSFNLIDNAANTQHTLTIHTPGIHNALNAAAAFAVAREEGVPANVIQKALFKFSGVERRFQYYGELSTEAGHILLIDDYGHHPTEINVTISAIRAGWPQRRIVMVFEPHRYSRTHELYDAFVESLSKVDVLIMLDVYSAGEKSIPHANSQNLCLSILKKGHIQPMFAPNIPQLDRMLMRVLQESDILVIQGAGDVGQLAKRLVKKQRKLTLKMS